MENKNTPKLRFKDFDKDWDKKKIKEVFYVSSGFTGDSSLNDGKYYITRIETIADGKVNIDKLGFSNILPNENYKLNRGDILYSNINSISHIGKVALFNVDKIIYHGINLLRLVHKSQFNAEFLFYQLNTDEKRAWARSHANQAVSQASINQTSLGKQDLSVASLPEQSAIGSLFQTLDELLSAYKDNLANYQAFKATMLSKMFPKAGQTTPEIRLDGFDGEWEEVGISEKIYSLKSGLSRELSTNDIGLPVVRANNINNGQLDLNNAIKYWYKNDPSGAKTENYLIHKDDILINFINSEAKMGTAAYVTEEPNRDTIYTTNILKMSLVNDVDAYFVFLLTFKSNYKYFIKSITKPAVNQASFTTVDFKKYRFLIPSLQEQKAIASFFKNLAELISSCQEKITQLETLKKKLLQDMFV
ncbi:restriction endonuclease subunit S [Streptococcus cameli]